VNISELGFEPAAAIVTVERERAHDAPGADRGTDQCVAQVRALA
jgi:hypothetical protein